MRIAALQMQAAAGDPAANLARIEAVAVEAAAKGASILVAPELAVTGYGAGEAILDLAEPADGPMAGRLAAIARATADLVLSGSTDVTDLTDLGMDRFDDAGRSRLAADPISLPYPEHAR